MALLQQKIVTIGAGTGQATVLKALRQQFAHLSAVVSVTDNGGHSGVLRHELNIPQVGDGRQVLTALATNTSVAERFAFRFNGTGALHGVSVGNLILASLCQKEGNIGRAFEIIGQDLGCVGRVFPATTVNTEIGAQLANGDTIIGEWEIMERASHVAITDLFLEPSADAYGPSLEAIQDADWVIIGPGSLLAGIIPIFLARGVVAAIEQSSARFIYVSNLMTQPGQTDELWTVENHVDWLARYMGRRPDVVIANAGVIPVDILGHYQQIGSRPVEQSHAMTERVVARDLVPGPSALPMQERIGAFKKWTHLLVHDQAKLATVITEVIMGTA